MIQSISLAVSHSGRFAATACKATSPEHAVLRVYETENWQPLGQSLGGHTLTVTKIAFSPDDRYILSVSRDRTWRLFERQEDDGMSVLPADSTYSESYWQDLSPSPQIKHIQGLYGTAHGQQKVIYSPRHRETKRSAFFSSRSCHRLNSLVTGTNMEQQRASGRKEKARSESQITRGSNSCCVRADRCRWAKAIGHWIRVRRDLDLLWPSKRPLKMAGRPRSLFNVCDIPLNLTSKLVHLNSRDAHVSQVHGLAWRPGSNGESKQLASCSEDGTLKVLRVHIGTV